MVIIKNKWGFGIRIVILLLCFDNGGICGTSQESNFVGLEQDFEINGGEQNFDVDDIEVFQIAFR